MNGNCLGQMPQGEHRLAKCNTQAVPLARELDFPAFLLKQKGGGGGGEGEQENRLKVDGEQLQNHQLLEGPVG